MNDLSQALSLLQKVHDAAAANDQSSTLTNLMNLSALHARAKALAAKLGLKVCGT